MKVHNVIKRPIVTEKSNTLKELHNAYVFEVLKSAGKDDVKNAVESQFNVKVLSVTTSIQRGKVKRFSSSMGRTKAWKKAVVKLGQGQKIQIFEGV